MPVVLFGRGLLSECWVSSRVFTAASWPVVHISCIPDLFEMSVTPALGKSRRGQNKKNAWIICACSTSPPNGLFNEKASCSTLHMWHPCMQLFFTALWLWAASAPSHHIIHIKLTDPVLPVWRGAPAAWCWTDMAQSCWTGFQNHILVCDRAHSSTSHQPELQCVQIRPFHW